MALFRAALLASTFALAACADEPPICYPSPRYMVFFDSDQSTLTGGARATVIEAAQMFRESGAGRVDIAGHTDLVGGDEHNKQLGMRRAQAIRAELEKHGVPATNIVVLSRGKSMPLVQTLDQVPEPQNRRAEIVIN